MICVQGICKQFGAAHALRDVSFEVARGERVGFVGPNGAGKSTMLRILSGFLSADTGSVQVGGYDVASERRRACEAIGYMPDSAPLHDAMRVSEFLLFRARLKGLDRSAARVRLDAVVAELELEAVRRRLIGRLSRGFRQRVALADALIADPMVLLLDEPTTGLDPIQRRSFRDVLRRLSQDRSVLFSSHLLPEVEAVAERFLVLHRGRLVANGNLEALRAKAGLGSQASAEETFAALVGAS